MPDAPLVSILTLGCKLNLADSEALAADLGRAGFAVSHHLCEADAFVVNTCSVTHVADQKSRKLIRSVRRLAPGAPVAVTGCFPRSAGEQVPAALGADIVAGTAPDDRAAIVAYLVDRAEPRAAAATPDPATVRAERTRAFVKAQEGCNDVCAFCIVPRTRGRERSRAAEDVAADVATAVDGGAREVVITGTQLGAWGRDFADPATPADLIATVLARTEVPRLRFSSLQPQDISPALLALWRDPRLMPHFHLALQSGSEEVLAAMRRRYTAHEFLGAAERIAAAVPGAAITTDVIAGFPGESPASFAETVRLCRAVGFARIHAFPYSVRSRTAAARLPDQVPPQEKRARMAELLAVAGELADAFARRFTGTTRPVLWEQRTDGPRGEAWEGYTDNYIRVRADGRGLLNRITPAHLGEPGHGPVDAVVLPG